MRLSLSLSALTGKYAERFVKFGAYSPTPLSLKKLTVFGQAGSAQESAKFLREELPVRLANIMQEIHLLPERLVQTPSASLVVSWYEKSFKELVDLEDLFLEGGNLDIFTDKLAGIRDRHSHVVETMAEGVMEMQERYGIDMVINNQVQYFLDRFYMMRISIRMLINQHVLLFGPELNKQRRFVGSIDPNCNIIEILENAYQDAKYLCEHYYAGAPEIVIKLLNADNNGAIRLTYVPSHLHHILFELIKNAMRAVMENVPKDTETYPKIHALVANGKENVTIKISDEGGGIPRSEMDFVFQYTYTTARDSHGGVDSSSQPSSCTGNAPLAGYGYGLPISRLYAKYFNGHLNLASVEGYGTDALVYLKRHAAEADEVLPVFNRTSAKYYGLVGLPVADWSHSQYTTGIHKP